MEDTKQALVVAMQGYDQARAAAKRLVDIDDKSIFDGMTEIYQSHPEIALLASVGLAAMNVSRLQDRLDSVEEKG